MTRPSTSQHVVSDPTSIKAGRAPVADPIRVGLWVPVWCSGGVERYHLALAMAAQQFTPGIVWVGCCLTPGARTMPDMVQQLDRLMPVTTSIDELANLCDVIVAWAITDLSPLEGFAAAGGKVVVIQHGDTTWSRIWLGNCLGSIRENDVGFSRVPVQLVAVSQTSAAVCKSFAQLVPILRAGIDMNRIMPSRPREDVRRSLGLKPDEFAVGFVGRFSHEKNPLMVAKIVGELGEGAVAVYHGYATGDDTQFKTDVLRHSGHQAIFLERQFHTGDVYAAIDCLVMASPLEAGPLVVIEAWLAGVPVVSTLVGVVAEHPGWAMIVNDPNSVAEFCAAIGGANRWQYPEDGAILQDIAQQASEVFSQAASARRWASFFECLVNGDQFPEELLQ